jgi:RNA polymerase sigma-70 factor (ECF subfamily)
MFVPNDAVEEVLAPSKDDLSDSSLLHRFQRGNDDAATQLYHRYANRLRALARMKCSSQLSRRVDADDIVQSVFRTFFRGARNGFYDIPAGEDLWKLLLVIALNKIRAESAYHRAAKRDVRLTVAVDEFAMEAGARSKRDDAGNAFLQLAIEEALDQLEPQQKAMVELRIQGHEVAAIADRTGRSKRTVERNLQEIRRKLSGLLGREH